MGRIRVLESWQNIRTDLYNLIEPTTMCDLESVFTPCCSHRGRLILKMIKIRKRRCLDNALH